MRSFILLAVAAASASAQQVQTKTFAKPDIEYSEPFSQLNGLAELRDGRVVTADSRDKTLLAIDLKTGKATPIGREGAGPQEWALPFGAFRWRGDSVIVNDAGNSRFLIVTPDGKPARTWSPLADLASAVGDAARGTAGRGGAGAGDGGRGGATASGGGGGRAVVGGPGGGRGGPQVSGRTPPRGTDAKGRVYIQTIPISFDEKTGNLVQGDSAPIVRIDPTTSQQDTVAFVNLAKNTATGAVSGNPGAGEVRVNVSIGGQTPFPTADDWTVLDDGTVVIVRAADYHVEIVPAAGGRRIVGRPVPFTPVRVTEADKKQWRDALRSAPGLIRSVGPGGTTNSTQRPPPPEPAAWPETKPAFGPRATFAAPNGDVWVTRSRSATDPVPTADVFNSQGQLIGKAVFPAKTRLVALGKNGVYLARIDDDDLQYLQRHAIQWTGCTANLRENCAR